MDTHTVSLEIPIPEDVYLTLKVHGVGREPLAQQARQLLALHYFQNHTLSLGKAARMAGMNLWDFITYLSQNEVPVVDLDEEEFAREMGAVNELAKWLRSQDSA